MKTYIKSAEGAVKFATQVRSVHRRRTPKSNLQRRTDINEARRRIKRTMKPLSRWLKQYQYMEVTEANEILREQVAEASRNLQRERVKLWKMER